MKIDPILIRSLALGTAGACALGLLGVPGGWIAGSMAVVAVAALSGVQVAVAPRMRDFGFLAIGISMGSGVTPETVARLPSWPITLALVVLTIPLIVGTVFLFLTRRAKWDKPTALLCAMPGALSYLLALAPSTNADISRVAILQTMRVAILVAILPVAAIWLTAPEIAPVSPAVLNLPQGLILFVGGAGGAILAHLLRVPAGLLIGGLFVSAFLHGAGLVDGRPPQWLAILGFIILGTMIGTRFAGTNWRELATICWVSFQSFVIGAVIAVAVAVLGTWITGLDLLKLIIAFAPGGLEVMVVLAFALDLDPAFVAAHHLTRFLLIALTAPFVLRAFDLSVDRST
ncbi:MAG: AbrB family transcriptional regulator [Hyphomicrobiales bacterium]